MNLSRRRFLQAGALFCAPAIVAEVMPLWVPDQEIYTGPSGIAIMASYKNRFITPEEFRQRIRPIVERVNREYLGNF